MSQAALPGQTYGWVQELLGVPAEKWIAKNNSYISNRSLSELGLPLLPSNKNVTFNNIVIIDHPWEEFMENDSLYAYADAITYVAGKGQVVTKVVFHYKPISIKTVPNQVDPRKLKELQESEKAFQLRRDLAMGTESSATFRNWLPLIIGGVAVVGVIVYFVTRSK